MRGPASPPSYPPLYAVIGKIRSTSYGRYWIDGELALYNALSYSAISACAIDPVRDHGAIRGLGLLFADILS